MSLYCSYQDCCSVRQPFGKITFFKFPKDKRRHDWIVNSGNPELHKVKENTPRYFCSKHFAQHDLREQFHRTTLRRDAVPLKYVQNCSDREEDVHVKEADEETDVNEDVLIEIIDVVDEADVDEQVEEEQYHEMEDESHLEYQMVTQEDQTEAEEEIIPLPPLADAIPEPDSVQEEEHLVSTTATEAETVQAPSQQAPRSNSYEEDKHFALSLVGYLQRLPTKKKSMAKLAILNYLTELELECEDS